MNARFGPMFAAVVVTLCGYVGTARAQIVTIQSVQYQAAAVGRPATAEPNGVISLPADGNVYRVYVDYGRIGDGAFSATANVSKGGSSQIVIPKTGANADSLRLLEAVRHVLPITLTGFDGNSNWSASGPQALKNPVAGLYARARIQKLNGTQWVDVQGAVAYAPVPIPEE